MESRCGGSDRSCPIGLSRFNIEYPIGYGSSDLLGASRLGPRSVALHGRIVQRHWRSRSESTLVRGRFPNLPQRACHGGIACCWSSREMYGVCRTVDGEQSFAIERGQNSADLDWFKAAAIENHQQRNSAAVCDCTVQFSCHEPWCHYRQRAEDGRPHCQPLQIFLFPATAATADSKVTDHWRTKDARSCIHQQSTGLLQQSSVWNRWRLGEETAERLGCGGRIYHGDQEIRSYHPCASRLALAADIETNGVQGSHSCLQKSTRSGTTISGWWLHPGVFCGWSFAVALCRQLRPCLARKIGRISTSNICSEWSWNLELPTLWTAFPWSIHRELTEETETLSVHCELKLVCELTKLGYWQRTCGV